MVIIDWILTNTMHTSPLLLKIGSNIKEARRKRQMTQLALAVLCHFEKASISKIESGKRNISILTLEKISQALDVEIGEFFKWIGEVAINTGSSRYFYL